MLRNQFNTWAVSVFRNIYLSIRSGRRNGTAHIHMAGNFSAYKSLRIQKCSICSQSVVTEPKFYHSYNACAIATVRAIKLRDMPGSVCGAILAFVPTYSKSINTDTIGIKTIAYAVG